MIFVLALACARPTPPAVLVEGAAPAERTAPVESAVPAEGATPGRIRVEPGVYRIGDREVWTGGFAIDALAVPARNWKDDAPSICEGRATPDEWQIAAMQPGFVASEGFEYLDEPPEDACDRSMAMVEAEGIEGWQYFGGWGAHRGEAQVLSGEGEPGVAISRLHFVSYYFFDEDAKPAPRFERCVARDPAESTGAWMTKDSPEVVLRARRDGGDVVLAVVRGAQIRVWHRQGDLAFVDALRTVKDDSSETEGTVYHQCHVRGWTSLEGLITSDG